MTTHRLTNQQRSTLRDYLISQHAVIQKYRPTTAALAEAATTDLGFEIKPSHVYYQQALMNQEAKGDEDMNDLAETYSGRNATATHGRTDPWELSIEQRTIETLERVRRIEVLAHLIAEKLDVDRRPNQHRQPSQQQELFSADDHRRTTGGSSLDAIRRVLGGSRSD